MTTFGTAVAWLVLSPLALITNIIAIVVVCHYRAQFHGTDVAFISLFVSMVTNALLVLPIPAGVVIHDDGWVSELCSFYVWLVLCVRMSELLVTVIMNIHWMCILRFTSGQEVYSSATVVKILVMVAWFASVVTGLVPVTGSTFYAFYDAPEPKIQILGASNPNGTAVLSTTFTRGQCRFLPYGIGASFALFFIVATLTALTVSVVASCDTLTVFRYMRRTAVDKYKAGRFYLPSTAAPANSYSKPGPTVGNGSGGRGTGLAAGGDSYPSGRQEPDGGDPEQSSKGPQTHYGGDNSLERGGGGNGVSSSRIQGNDVRTLSSTNSGGYYGEAGTGATSPGNRTTSLTGNGSVVTSPGATQPTSSQPNSKNGGTAANRRGVPNSAAAVVVRPSSKSGVAKATVPTVHARYNELSLSAELCRVVLCYTLFVGLVQHLPFVVLQFVQLVESVDRYDAQTVVLFLTLTQSLLAPHVLWLLSRRYRHALVYTWTVHVLRDDSAKEEDPSSCTLQSYTRKVRTPDGGTVRVTARVRGHAPITSGTFDRGDTAQQQQQQPNGSAVVDRTGAAENGAHGEGTSGQNGNHVPERARANGRIITTDLDDGMTVITNLASNKVTYVYDTSGSERQSTTTSPEDARARSPQLPESSGNSRRSSQTTSPSRSSLGTPSRGSEVQRTSSARRAWKEQMRKKHLPAIFVNEAFDAEEEGLERRVGEGEGQKLPDVAIVQADHVSSARQVDNADGTVSTGAGADAGRKEQGFHYYMSGDFHYDYLRGDSLPPFAHQESESEGGSFLYDDNDIEGILDREHSSRSRSSSATVTTFLGNHSNQQVRVQGTSSHPNKTSAEGHGPRMSTFSSVDNSDSKSGSEGGKGRGSNPAARKPPRRSGPAVRQGSRTPSLQYQHTLHHHPDSDHEETVNSVHNREQASEVNASVTQQNSSRVSSAAEHVSGSSSNEGGSSGQGDLAADEHDGRYVSLMQPDIDETSDDSEAAVVIGESHHVPEAVNPAYTSAIIDTDDVYLRIDYVTDDATNTDERTSPQPPSPRPRESRVAASRTDTEEEFHPKDGASVMGLLLQEEPSDAQQRGLERDTEFKHPDDERVYSQPSGQRTSHSGTDNDNGQSASAKTQSVDAAVAPDDSESNSSLHTDDHDGQRERMITRVHSGVSPPPTAVVLDILETSSTGSDHSVVLEPYNEDRRPPWMDADLDDEEDGKYSRSYFGNPFLTHVPNSSEDSDVFGSSGDFGSSGGPFTFGDSVNSARSSSRNPFRSASFENSSTRFFSHEPLLSESDSDTPQSSGNSGQLRGIRELNAGIFDHETEMGFEEALATDHMAGAPHFYGNMGLCFESIEEEPEEFSDSMTSSNKDGDDSIFKTQAIVSRPSSRNSIVDSGSNPFTSGNSGDGNNTNPFTSNTSVDPVWGTRLSSTGSDVNPFEATPSPVRTLADGKESPGSIPHGTSAEEGLTNGDVDFHQTTDTKSAPPRISLTKPTPWPGARPNDVTSDNDVTSGSNRLGFDSDFSQTSVKPDDSSATVSGGGGGPRRRPPPPPPKPSKISGNMETQRSDSPKSNINPVYF